MHRQTTRPPFLKTGATSSTILTLPYRCSSLSSIKGTQREEAEKAINIPAQEDAFNSIRTEYGDMLKSQLSKGNNGLVKHKYITFSIEADNMSAAKSRLSRIETDILNNFKVLGVSARPQTGYERLQTMHGVFHPEGSRFILIFHGLPRPGLPQRTLSPRPHSVLARGGISAWGARSARYRSYRYLRRS